MTRMAFNPLPWFLTADGFHPELAPPLVERLRVIREAGYDSVHADVPDGMTATDYKAMLHDEGLVPAPGYFQAPFSVENAASLTIEQAKRMAEQHAELGLDRIFLADQFGAATARLATPAVGVEHDDARTERIAAAISVVATAMTAEGVVPCLHQHVGTWIESPLEVEQILAAVSADVLLLGPDTGHLAWAGADPVSFIAKHRQRIGAVHIKDVRLDVAQRARNAGESYAGTTAQALWTEPGRGDLDLDGVLEALGEFDGWFVVEVDIADQPTVAESAKAAADWLRPRLEERARA